MFVTVRYADDFMRLFLWQETNRPVLLLGWALEFFCEVFLFLCMVWKPVDFFFDALPLEL
jgi:hypothetical protein